MIKNWKIIEASNPFKRITTSKVKKVLESGFKICGYILEKEDQKCIVSNGYVRWSDTSEFESFLRNNNIHNDQISALKNLLSNLVSGSQHQAVLPAGLDLVSIQNIIEKYTPPPIPLCPICNGELHVDSFGVDQPTIWACDALDSEGNVDFDHKRKSTYSQFTTYGDLKVSKLANFVKFLVIDSYEKDSIMNKVNSEENYLAWCQKHNLNPEESLSAYTDATKMFMSV